MRQQLIELISEICSIIKSDGSYNDIEALQQKISSLGHLSEEEKYLLRDCP